MANDALDYGTDNNSRYYAVDVSTTSLVLPDGDWCVGMWIRLPNGLLTTMDYQYVFSAGTIGASNSFHVFFGESSSFNDVVVRFNGAAGTEVNQNVATGVGNATTGINTDDHLMVIQRVGTTIYTYWILEGATVSAATNSFSNNSNTTNTFPSLNIGRRPDGNSTRYFGNVVGEVFILTSDSLTNSELTTLAAGAHIDAVRASPYLDLRFRGSNATETDQSGNGYDGTRNGTGWTLVNEFFPDSAGTDISATTDALVLTESAATITFDVEVLATVDVLLLVEQAATITTTTDTQVDATTDALSLTEQAAVITLDVNVTGTTDTLAISTYAVSVDLAVGSQQIITGNQMITTKKDSAFPLEVAVDSTGGVTGLSVSATIRDINNAASYLDFNDSTFKTSGWTTKAKTLTDLGLGFYGTTLDITAITNLPTGKSLAIEYDISGSVVSIDHGVITFLDDYLTTGKYIGLS